MSPKLRNQLKEIASIGSKLQKPPSSKDALVKLLKQATTCLSELDQSPSPSRLESMRPCLNAIVKPEFLKHQDRDVKLLVATCICEITRITAPEAPYSDDVLRDIFRLIVGTFRGLENVNGPSFGRRVAILETVAKYRSCIVMLDLECDDLVNEMFSIFFAVARDDHPESVLTSMETVMILLIEESEDIQENLLVTLLSVLGRGKSDFSLAARKLSMNVIEHCTEKLESCIKQLLISSMTGEKSSLTSQMDYHEVIFDIFRCAPQIFSGLIPYLTGELLADQLDTRLKAVNLLGDLFSLPDCVISEAFQSIFSEFLKRLTDRAVEVRLSAVGHLKSCLLSNPLRPESPQIIAALRDRLLDYDENVRKEVVAAVCDIACCTLKSIPVETLGVVAERLRDKTLIVKRYTMERIAEIYRVYCLKCSDGSVSASEFDWIPGKILRCFYDKEVRAETIEVVLCGSLFPMELSNIEKMRHWVSAFSGFEKVEVKALEKILEQKQRLQQEMQKYLSLKRLMHQDSNCQELQKKMLNCFRVMSRWFSDPLKAEENFQTLDQLKDANVWKILSILLDPNTSFQQAWSYRDDLLKILGEKHPLYDFLVTLSVKCSYLLFNKECVKEILLEVTTQKSAGNTLHIGSCMNILVILACVSPSLFSGTEDILLNLIKEDDDIIKEGALHILARAGGTIREQLAETSCSLELILERLCLEGTRKQAKYAVHALAAITKDDGLKSLSVLYKRLVDTLLEKTHLPAILQALGCIAQSAMSIFETRESEIVGFITSSILECSNKAEGNSKTGWEERSELCTLKMYGLKTLVKSYLPVKDANLRRGIENFLAILKNVLLTGEVSINVKSSSVDKAHMKLASAKAILRLSKHWDHRIPIDVFHLTIRAPEANYPRARTQFVGKIMQYIKDRLLDVKYSCALMYSIIRSTPPEFEEEKHNLVEVIQMCYQAKARQHPMLCEGNQQMPYPEYILPFVVHALAHDSSCPNIDECTDVKAFEPMYRQLHLFLSVLVHCDEDDKSEASDNKEKERIATVISIFQTIKCSEDVLDVTKSKNSYAASDIGLLICKHLTKKPDELTGLTLSIPLPSTLYKLVKKKDSLVNEEQSWLHGASILAHLESVNLQSNGTVTEDVKDLEDGDRDGNNVPLRQMLKKIKAQGTKTKIVGKNKIVPSEAKNAEDDILGMVREINLNNLERSGHEYILSGETDEPSIDKKVLVSRKRKRRKTGDATTVAVPKRKRSSSAHSVHSAAHSWSSAKGLKKSSGDYSRDTDFPSSQCADEEAHTGSTSQILMEEEAGKPREADLQASSSLTSKRFLTPKCKGMDHSLNMQDIGETDYTDVKPIKSSVRPIKKRKRKSITGLAKCSSAKGEEHTLVGCQIKVWWPLDKRFYEGLVQSYDPGKKKHVILYQDGETEVLKLEKERWELIADGHSTEKVSKTQNISTPKNVLPDKKKNNRPESSLRNKRSKKKSSSSIVRRKATPNKSEHRQSGNLDGKANASHHAESGRISDLSNCDSEMKYVEEREKIPTNSEDDEEKKPDTEGEQVENADASLMDVQDYDEERSVSEAKQVAEVERIPPDAEESEKEETSDSEGQQQVDRIDKKLSDAVEAEDGTDSEGEKITRDLEQPDKDEKLDSPKANEDSDNEPLGMWKRRIGKGKAH